MVDIVIPLKEFPTSMSTDSDALNEFDTWALIAPKKTGYKYDMETYSFTMTHDLQPSPLEPGVYLYPPNVVDENPVEVCGELGEKEEYYYNTTTKTWSKRLDMFLFPLFEKKSGARVQTPLRENADKYTILEPTSNFALWDEKEETWLVDVDKAKEQFISSVEMIANELRVEKIDLNGKPYNGLSDLQTYTETYNSLLDGQNGIILSGSEVLEVSKEDLKKLINMCLEFKVYILKTTAYFKTELNNAVTLDDLYNVIDLSILRQKQDEYGIEVNNKVVEYVATRLSDTLNTRSDNDPSEVTEITTNPSQELYFYSKIQPQEQDTTEVEQVVVEENNHQQEPIEERSSLGFTKEEEELRSR